MTGQTIQFDLVTSVNTRLWEAYGRRFAEEFAALSDGSVSLHIIYETANAEEPPDFKKPNVFIHKFNHPGHSRFLTYFGNLFEASGYKLIRDVVDGEVKSIRLLEDYRFDAVRFSFKPFAIDQFKKSFSKASRSFAWIDADMRVLTKISAPLLLEFFPSGPELMSYLGRERCTAVRLSDLGRSEVRYSECGFLGFNANHPSVSEFLNRVCEIYITGEIFSHEEWHDSWLWDVVRRGFDSRPGCNFKNLSVGVDHLSHPFVNSGLGAFFDHLKGPKRKANGRSFETDRE
jgi:hypothetical protein